MFWEKLQLGELFVDTPPCLPGHSHCAFPSISTLTSAISLGCLLTSNPCWKMKSLFQMAVLTAHSHENTVPFAFSWLTTQKSWVSDALDRSFQHCVWSQGDGLEDTGWVRIERRASFPMCQGAQYRPFLGSRDGDAYGRQKPSMKWDMDPSRRPMPRREFCPLRHVFHG